MTPAEAKLLRQADSVEERVSLLLGAWRRMRAVVRVTCGYTPATLRSMSWEEMRDAWRDAEWMIKQGLKSN